ncbi:MAG: hypothetical protein ACRCW7_07620 [Cetobacterium sp.]
MLKLATRIGIFKIYKMYSNSLLNKGKLRELIDIVGGINLQAKTDKGQDGLGQVYEFS